jgi:hypothetical protein
LLLHCSIGVSLIQPHGGVLLCVEIHRDRLRIRFLRSGAQISRWGEGESRRRQRWWWSVGAVQVERCGGGGTAASPVGGLLSAVVVAPPQMSYGLWGGRISTTGRSDPHGQGWMGRSPWRCDGEPKGTKHVTGSRRKRMGRGVTVSQGKGRQSHIPPTPHAGRAPASTAVLKNLNGGRLRREAYTEVTPYHLEVQAI